MSETRDRAIEDSLEPRILKEVIVNKSFLQRLLRRKLKKSAFFRGDGDARDKIKTKTEKEQVLTKINLPLFPNY